jgi:toxin-antitoxin system PIN domain toxin
MPDVNLLVYAHDRSSPVHSRARAWWEDRLNDSRLIGLSWMVLLGFIRVSTDSRIYRQPRAVEEILGFIEDWLTLPHVEIVQPTERHREILSGFLRHLGAAGNLTPDAHLAALAVERGLILQTTDSDFARFPGLKWRNPLA